VQNNILGDHMSELLDAVLILSPCQKKVLVILSNLPTIVLGNK
jgi:hypothetical protein